MELTELTEAKIFKKLQREHPDIADDILDAYRNGQDASEIEDKVFKKLREREREM